MKNILLLLVGLTLISCEEDLIQNYQFEMNGRTYQDNNGYYHLTIDPIENQQTIHRFGAYVTNVDTWGIPTQVIWNCDAVWSYELFTNDMNVPIVNGTSFVDPIIDSVYCIMAPVGGMIGDTVTISGKAIFEEGDIILYDSFQMIFE